MNEQEIQLKATEANDLAHKIMDMLRDLNPDPRVAIVSLFTVSAEISMSLGLPMERTIEGFAETWDVVQKHKKEGAH